jgi:hypothetical protein
MQAGAQRQLFAKRRAPLSRSSAPTPTSLTANELAAADVLASMTSICSMAVLAAAAAEVEMVDAVAVEEELSPDEVAAVEVMIVGGFLHLL